MRTFKDYVGTEKKKKSDRSNHLKWSEGDLDMGEDEDRESHFSWGPDDVEHHGQVKEDKTIQSFGPAHLQPHNVTHIDYTDLHNHEFTPEEEEHHWEHKNRLYESGHHFFAHDYKYSSHDYNEPLRKSVRREGHILLGHMAKKLTPNPNEWGRNNSQEKIDKITQLEKVTSNRTPRDMTVYRGLGPDAGLHKRAPGSLVQDHGFTGTSLKLGHAFDFTNRYTSEHNVHPHFIGMNTFARIHVPAGSLGHHLDIDPDSPHREEHEFLLHRGTKFRVLGHHTTSVGESHFHMVDLRVEGHHPKKLINPYE